MFEKYLLFLKLFNQFISLFKAKLTIEKINQIKRKTPDLITDKSTNDATTSKMSSHNHLVHNNVEEPASNLDLIENSEKKIKNSLSGLS